MRRSKPVALAASLVLTAGAAMAAYNTPAKAKKLKVDLSVAYNVCGGSPNASLVFGMAPLPACTPPVPTTSNNPTNLTTFGPKGAASVQIGVATGDLKIGIKSIDVLNNGVPANSINLTAVSQTVVSTSGNCAMGLGNPTPDGTECTSQNIGPLFSAVFPVPCLAGKCALKTSVNTLLPGTITIGGKANTNISGIGLADPDGDLAFTEGIFLP
jgi:hypothetical protein